jgi:hypothetical protein
MSTLAKTFIFFNLVMTVIFFGSSATLFLSRHNWREAYEANTVSYQGKLDELRGSFEAPMARLRDLEQKNASLSTANANLASQKKAADGQIETLKGELVQAQSAVEKLAQANDANQQTLQTYVNQLAEKDRFIGGLQGATDEAQQSERKARQDLTRVVIDLDKNQHELDELQVAYNDLDQKTQRLEIQMANLARNGINPESYEVPRIEGIVAAVRPEDRLVVLSVGKDQKVMPGYVFSVRRGPEYIGKVEVIEVYDDLSGARITYVDESQQIAPGDQVETSARL